MVVETRRSQVPTDPRVSYGSFHGTHASLKFIRELMRHAQGGASVCALVTRTEPPPSPETVDMVSGVITNAPLFELTEPIPVWLKVIATAIAALFPNLPFPARMVEDVGALSLIRHFVAYPKYDRDSRGILLSFRRFWLILCASIMADHAGL